MDVKFLTMTEDDSFVPADFMAHSIRILLGLNPNSKFFTFVNKMID